MRIWEPWETAWPAGVAVVVLVVALGRCWRRLRPGAAAGRLYAGLFCAALFVRLVGVPALARHGFDGHEAEFYDLFLGVRAVNRGGTVLYPAMQWMWAGLGSVLPHQPWVPVVLMSGVGAASVVVCADLARLLLRDPARPRRGLVSAAVAGAVVALHPVHSAWSSSAYNVVLPFFLGSCVLWVGAQVGRSRQPSLWVATAGAAAWALVVATRLDAALVGLPAALLAVFLSPLDTPWRDGVRRRWVLILPLVVGLCLGAAAALPLVYPGEVPGAGERELAFWVHLPMLEHYLPFGPAGLWVAVLVMCAVAALREDAVLATVLLVGVVANHLVMSSFDDLGDRHLLLAVPLAAVLVALGAAGGPRVDPRRLVGLAGPPVLVLTFGLIALSGRFYAEEEAFVADARSRLAALPTWSLEQARDGCGWINEDPRAAADPVASHFNVLDAGEAEALRSPSGCLRWCADLQDWRWSSRGVADRARRMGRLFTMRPVAMVTDEASGYACEVWDLTARRCCTQ